MADLRNVVANWFRRSDPATDPSDCVRLDDMTTALAAKSNTGHTHAASAVTDFTAAVELAVFGYVANTDSITWMEGGATLQASVRVKTGGGVGVGPDGIFVSLGQSGTQAAPGDHTHSQLHDPATVLDSTSIDLNIVGQQITGSVICKSGGGILIGPDGLYADVGSSGTQLAAGNHTHSQLHDALSVVNSDTLGLSVSAGQVLSGVVRMDSAPSAGRGKLGFGPAGVYVELGTAADNAAAGNHVHSVATQAADGFLSAADKRKLDAYADVLQTDASVLFTRHDELPQGKYVGGRHRWGQSMQIVNMHLTASAPASECTLGLEVGGVVLDTIAVPAGAAGDEVTNYKAITDIFVPADTYVRILGTSGVATIEDNPSRLNVSLLMRPGLATAPTIRINCGGSESTPYATDGYYDTGSVSTTATAINTAGVTDPAPQAVYKAARRRTTSGTLNYTVTGLARGIDYLVRLHFATWNHDAAGEELFTIRVIGATTQTTANYDIVNAAGGKYIAVVQEYTLKADTNGQIIVQLQTVAASGGVYECTINGIEMIPQ